MNDSELAALQWIERHQDGLFDLLQRLVAIPTLAGMEWKCKEVVEREMEPITDVLDVWEPDAAWLEEHPAYFPRGMSYEGRPNIVGIIEGRGEGKSIILNAHVDVVDPGPEEAWKHGPWSGVISQGRLHGRGSADDKAGLAVMIFIAQCFHDLGIQLKGDIILESVVDEEWGGGGTLSTFQRGYFADAAVAFEPTSLAICPASRGGQAIRVSITGKGAHPVRSYDGVSALEKAIPILIALKKLERDRQQRLRTKLFESYPIFVPIVIGKISADEFPSKVPEKCIFEGLVGYSPDETFEEVRRELESCIAGVASQDPWLAEHPPRVEWHGLNKEGAQISPAHPFVRQLENAFEDVMDVPSRVVGFPAGCDLPFFINDADIPSVVFGPGDLTVAHTSHEYVQLEEVLQAAKILSIVLLRWCN